MGGDTTPAIQLRGWQSDALEAYFKANQRDFLAVVTPGGGKTIWALSVVTQLRKMERLIVVCQTVQIKSQWIAAAEVFGIVLSDLAGLISNHVVTTYQQVSRDPELFHDLVEEMSTAVIFDEIHHGSDSNSWGESCLRAFGGAYRRLALTGTAFRSDSGAIPFVTYDDGVCRPDYVYGYRDAVADGVCRAVEFPVHEGNMCWRREGEEEQRRRFSDRVKKSDRSARLRSALDPGGDFLRGMLSAADTRLSEFPGEGGLVITRDTKHAEAIAAVLAEVSGEAPAIIHTYSDSVASTLSSFRNGAGRWLVSVNMVSEGVDIPRLRVLVYATNKSTDLFFRQAIGRIVRGRGGAICFVPAHRRFLEMVEEIGNERYHAIANQDQGESEKLCGNSGVRREIALLGSEGWEERVIRSVIDRDVAMEPSPVIVREKQKQKARSAEYRKDYFDRNPDKREENLKKNRELHKDPDWRQRRNQKLQLKRARKRAERGEVVKGPGLAPTRYANFSADRLREVRLARGVKTSWITFCMVCHYEGKKRYPEDHMIERLANTLGIDPLVLEEPVGTEIPPGEANIDWEAWSVKRAAVREFHQRPEVKARIQARIEAKKEERRQKKASIDCAECGTPFVPVRANLGKTCSQECKKARKARIHRERVEKTGYTRRQS